MPSLFYNILILSILFYFLYLTSASILLYLLSYFLVFHMFICCAPTHKGKFLVCENLLGNKTDSDSDVRHLIGADIDRRP